VRVISDPHIVVAIYCCGAAVVFALLAWVLGLHDDDDDGDYPLIPFF
jgi:hypothetical protein